MVGTTAKKVWRGLWRVMLVAGLLLVAFMVTVEGELGALPLALVLVGLIGSVATWKRRRGA